MKPAFKIIFFLCLLLAGVYVTTPHWLPHIIARQLPSGWQLETLESGFPGLTGINIALLRVKGKLPVTEVALDATNIRVNYHDLKIDIGSLSLDVYLATVENRPAEGFVPDDLSLPVIRLNSKLVELSVSHSRIALHQTTNMETGNILSGQAVILNLDDFKLKPGSDMSFQSASNVSFEMAPRVSGRFELSGRQGFFKAIIQFPAAASSPPWLKIQIEQKDQRVNTTTHIEAAFDAELANQEWLDSLLSRSSGGVLTHVGGKLALQADFTGQDLQTIDHVSLSTEGLQVESNSGTLNLDAILLASLEGEKVLVELPVPAEIQYQDDRGGLDALLARAVPGLQRAPRQDVNMTLALASNSRFLFQPGISVPISYKGKINFDLDSSEESFSLQASALQLEMEDILEPTSTTANGLISLDWKENTDFAFTSEELALKADQLSLSSTGNLRINHQSIDFEQTGNFEARLENMQVQLSTGQSLQSNRYAMQGRVDFNGSMSTPDAPVNFYFAGPVTAINPMITLPGDEHSQPLTITASDLSFTTELTSQQEKLISTGSGTLMEAQISPPVTSATQIDLTWQDLDLLNLAGTLSTRTQGFETEFEGELWSGFNVDLTYSLRSNTDVRGEGLLTFDNGPALPINFAGNTEAERWKITLPSSTIKLAELGSLLRVAHIELPASVRLTDGFIDLQGNVAVNDEITAKMAINGYEMTASMHESNANQAGFSFKTDYDQMLSASGPISIEAVVLAGGVDVTHISADLILEKSETFLLQNLYAEVFDGVLNLDSLQFSNTHIEDTTAELTHINLGHLLAFADIDGLQGTGLLEISLPLSSDETGVFVKNGRFSSTKPGRLTYTQEGVAGGNIGLQALENFQYQDLSGTIDYQSDGAYQIGIHLEGKNPDLYGGHPIVFNLNISGTLPALFEALFITGDFEESILKQIGINQ